MDGIYVGPHEKGKDAVFVSVDPLGIQNIYVLQTKKGALNLSKQVSSNVLEAETQLKNGSRHKGKFN